MANDTTAKLKFEAETAQAEQALDRLEKKVASGGAGAEKAAAQYKVQRASLEQLREEFIAAGGNAEVFDAKLDELDASYQKHLGSLDSVRKAQREAAEDVQKATTAFDGQVAGLNSLDGALRKVNPKLGEYAELISKGIGLAGVIRGVQLQLVEVLEQVAEKTGHSKDEVAHFGDLINLVLPGSSKAFYDLANAIEGTTNATKDEKVAVQEATKVREAMVEAVKKAREEQEKATAATKESAEWLKRQREEAELADAGVAALMEEWKREEAADKAAKVEREKATAELKKQTEALLEQAEATKKVRSETEATFASIKPSADRRIIEEGDPELVKKLTEELEELRRERDELNREPILDPAGFEDHQRRLDDLAEKIREADRALQSALSNQSTSLVAYEDIPVTAEEAAKGIDAARKALEKLTEEQRAALQVHIDHAQKLADSGRLRLKDLQALGQQVDTALASAVDGLEDMAENAKRAAGGVDTLGNSAKATAVQVEILNGQLRIFNDLARQTPAGISWEWEKDGGGGGAAAAAASDPAKRLGVERGERVHVGLPGRGGGITGTTTGQVGSKAGGESGWFDPLFNLKRKPSQTREGESLAEGGRDAEWDNVDPEFLASACRLVATWDGTKVVRYYDCEDSGTDIRGRYTLDGRPIGGQRRSRTSEGGMTFTRQRRQFSGPDNGAGMNANLDNGAGLGVVYQTPFGPRGGGKSTGEADIERAVVRVANAMERIERRQAGSDAMAATALRAQGGL